MFRGEDIPDSMITGTSIFIDRMSLKVSQPSLFGIMMSSKTAEAAPLAQIAYDLFSVRRQLHVVAAASKGNMHGNHHARRAFHPPAEHACSSFPPHAYYTRQGCHGGNTSLLRNAHGGWASRWGQGGCSLGFEPWFSHGRGKDKWRG